ncbi:MAG: BA14K family protein [Hyphomicrobiaceae bacterium]
MTRIQKTLGGLVAAVCFAVTTSMVSHAAVEPRSPKTAAGTQSSNVLQFNGRAPQTGQARQGLVRLAQRRGRRGPRRRFRRGRRRGGRWIGPVIGAGIAAIIIGGAIEASRRNYRDRWELCDEEFRSFRWSDGTYQPYGGGPRRLCPYLRRG